jgi:uncharacterized membrane protein YsdA (DUF1294 family)
MTHTTLLLLAAAYALLSAVAFILYARDKSAARANRRRVPERTLHLVALAGGWPGALVAQRVFRHKTRKRPFRLRFLATVVLNSAVLLWLLAWLLP